MIPDELKNAKPLTGNDRLGMTRDSDYLGAEDIDPGTEPVLTIDHIYNAKVTLARGKEQKDVMTFKEQTVNGLKNVRPLIVNATNRKTLRKLFGAVTANSLEGKCIQLYLEHNVRDPSSGDKVDGIRIRPRIPNKPKAEPIICANCGKPIVAVGSYSAEDVAEINQKRFGKAICAACSKSMAEAKPDEQTEQESSVDPTNE